MFRSALYSHVVIIALLGVLSGCAHSTARSALDIQPAGGLQVDAPPARGAAPTHAARGDLRRPTPAHVLPHVPEPRSERAARLLLSKAATDFQQGRFALAAARFRAVLKTDFLTDEGRAHVYRYAARAHHALGDVAGEQDALGAFVLASELVANPETFERARLDARARLAAVKVRDDERFGRSRDVPIPVDDPREPSSVIGALRCGAQGRSGFEDVSIAAVSHKGARLLRRRASCRAGSETIELWFNVTWAQRPRPASGAP